MSGAAKRFTQTMTAIFTGPPRELLAGLDRCLEGGVRGLLWIALGLVAGWWVYVPIHELLHAAGCLAAGGSVTRLEIDPMYGAAALARIFPFVEVGSEYAGRLSGFDTRGSDWIYLATDLTPYLLTILPGVWWLRRAGRRGQAALFGAALPFAWAPFLSLTGDAYEIGSLVAVHLPPARGNRILVGDDLFRKASELDLSSPAMAVGFILAIVLGVVWAFGWYAIAARAAEWLGEPALMTGTRGAESERTPPAGRDTDASR